MEQRIKKLISLLLAVLMVTLPTGSVLASSYGLSLIDKVASYNEDRVVEGEREIKIQDLTPVAQQDTLLMASATEATPRIKKDKGIDWINAFLWGGGGAFLGMNIGVTVSKSGFSEGLMGGFVIGTVVGLTIGWMVSNK